MKLPKKNRRRSLSSQLDLVEREARSEVRAAAKQHKEAPPEASRYRRSSYQGNRERSRSSLAGRTPVRRRKKPEERPIFSNGRIDFNALFAFIKKWTLDRLRGISIEKEDVIRSCVIGAAMILLALLQTTVFTQLPPFGAVPDLMLSFVIATAVSEGEKWGAAVALISALVISSLGTVGATVLPIVYLICAYLAGILSRYYLRQNALIRLMYQVAAGFVSGIGTLIMISATSEGFTIPQVMMHTIIPEYFSTLILSPFVHIIVYLALRSFHRSRAQRTDEM